MDWMHGGNGMKRTITLPYPDPSLSPNRKNGAHWAATKAKKDSAKEAGYYMAKVCYASEKPENVKTPVTITFTQSDKRKRDLDNLLAASKPAIDGIAQGMGIDDSLFEPITVKRAYDTQSYMTVEIG
jgi:crossover junction endodeoxyribonuclease RusA